VPSEFEGALNHRPDSEDALDRGTSAVIDLLRRWSQSKSHRMEYTVFSCGLFYERFAPNGLSAYNIGGGQNGGALGPGEYLVDVEAQQAEVVENNAQGRPVMVSMTSVYDVARFVRAAVEMGPGSWPREFKMRGDHMSLTDLVTTFINVRGGACRMLPFLRCSRGLISS
jgi:acetylornithine deacetylase/succinyl-diaminopimelate desuccinylase-like protein